MDFDFAVDADDFFVNLNLRTTLALPTGRETILHFCDMVRKHFPSMNSFHQRDSGEFVLEADRQNGSYRWVELQSHNLAAGFFNPPNLEEAYRLHHWLLERSVYHLGIGSLDVDALDVMFGFNLIYQGNRDAIVTRSLLSGSPLGALSAAAEMTPMEFEPNLTIAMDEECYLQARLSVETRNDSYQVRTGQYETEPISVYLTVRQYPSPAGVIDMLASFDKQRAACEDFARRLVIPHVIRPIAAAIATAQ